MRLAVHVLCGLVLFCGGLPPAGGQEPVPLWDPAATVPTKAAAPILDGVEFHVIKPRRPDTDGCNWTLGVGLAWHGGKLYASYGFNKGSENTASEEAHVRASADGGKTWGPPVVIDAGEGNLGVSHGVFLSHGGRLRAFMGAFFDKFQKTHTRAYLLDEATGAWKPEGIVVNDGFWPMQEPQQTADGNWIMAGFRVANGYPVAGHLPAVAISRGADFTRWDLVVIEAEPGLGDIWGESTVIVDGGRITNIARYGGKAVALVSTSADNGRTWTRAAPSNLPMATSKPYAGTLSTGQRFLACTTTADTGGGRAPLTIAVSRPGSPLFSKVFVVRHAVSEKTPGVSAPGIDFSYPYAIEHDGRLYVGYTHKSHIGNELAVIPVASLAVPGDVGVAPQRRGLPLVLFNDDSDDLTWPAYPESCLAQLGSPLVRPPAEARWEKEFVPWIEGRGARPAIPTAALGFDYSRPEVRERLLDTIRKACRRYDLDGVELDWLRSPRFFRDGEVQAATMTEFVREVRGIMDEAGKRRGHPLRLVARVPVTPERAVAVGLDVEAWLKAGWLDGVVFRVTSAADATLTSLAVRVVP